MSIKIDSDTQPCPDVRSVLLRPSPGNGKGTSQSEEVSLFDRTCALIRGLQLILAHHRVDESICVALANQVHDYLDSSLDESMWLKRGKYLLSYPFALYLRNDPPESPDLPFVPKGCLRRFMNNRLLNFNNKNTHLWYSWLQSKRSALPASDSQIQLNYEKHRQTLTSPDTGNDQTIESIMSNPDFLEHLDRVREGVAEKLYGSEKGFTDYNPSLSACSEKDRKHQGSYGALRKLVWSKNERRIMDISNFDELHSMKFFPNYAKGRKFLTNHVAECRSDLSENQAEWEDSLFRSRTQIKKKILLARIQGIVEPMKVRVISKGAALEYYVMKPLQQALHSTMRRMPTYRLLDRPLSPTDVMDLYSHIPTRTDNLWISVDYSGATDNLSWKYSSKILDYVISDLPMEFQDIARSVLGPHQLQYPKEGKWIEGGIMQRGQLMGSILSFPILCLANTGLYLHNTQTFHRGMTPDERFNSVLVNGDDQLYIAPKELFDSHISYGRDVGLEMTVGKAYHHKKYTNVNSTCVVCPIGGTPTQINFLNTGLYFGQNKVMRDTSYDESEKTRCGIVSLLPKVLSGSLPGRQCQLLKSWLVHHRGSIRKDCYIKTLSGTHNRNLFLPIAFGGMGIEAPLGFKFFISKADRKFARAVTFSARKLIEYSTTSRPLRDPSTYGNKTMTHLVRQVVTCSEFLPVSFKTKTPLSSFFCPKRLRLPLLLSGSFALAA